MKHTAFILLVILITNCTSKTPSPTEQVTSYYNGFKAGDYAQIKTTLAESLTVTEGDFVMPYTPENYYHKHFAWDSVFNPEYNLLNIEKDGKTLIATVATSSVRFEFLKNNPLTTTQKFHFTADKISKVENLDFINVDWEAWEAQKTNLVNWTKANHPELDGFINDLSMQGGLDYLKAIELYEKSLSE